MNYSVLLPVYKSDNPEYFVLSLESMLNQTVVSDDIVIVIDGPIPIELQTVVETYKRQYPNIIHPLQLEKNMGLGLALNEGIKECKNELIARMDADDISLPQRCEKQLEMFENDPELDIVGCRIKSFKGDTSNIIGYKDVPLENNAIQKYARRRDPFGHPSVMYRKSAVLTYGPYGDYRKNQDTDLWIKLLSNGCKGANCSDFLLLFRHDDNAYKRRKSWLNTKLLIQIRWYAYRIHFCSFLDFLIVASGQLVMFLLPIRIQKYLYNTILRKKVDK